jgi:hypothetical protein
MRISGPLGGLAVIFTLEESVLDMTLAGRKTIAPHRSNAQVQEESIPRLTQIFAD